MADTKIKELTTLDAFPEFGSSADWVPFVDGSDTSMAATGTTKKLDPNYLASAESRWAGDVASAATVSFTGNYVNVTGTTTITAFDMAPNFPGKRFWVRFAGVLTLTHHASNLILPTAANITTAAGDTAEFLSTGYQTCRCLLYHRASGQALVAPSVSTATQSDQETATSTTTYVTPGRQQFHPSAAKAWAKVGISGGSPDASFNISSVTDGGPGIVTFTIDTDFSSANWACTYGIENIDASIDASTDVQCPQIGLAGQAAGSVQIICGNASGTAAVDPTKWHFAGHGDQ